MKYEVMRAEEEWQRAGAYSVRVTGMNRQHKISLRDEFDELDCEGTKYIVILDDGYPIGTCRFYETDQTSVMLGRVVVLPEYRGQHIGSLILSEAEKWAKELGYTTVNIESRVSTTEFYSGNGYQMVDDTVIMSGVFECVTMKKEI